MSARATVVVPGNFDGVHLGHRALLDTGRTCAVEHDADTVPMFFHPHPAEVLGKGARPVLTTPERRTELLLALGADRVHQQPFDREFAALLPEAFVEQVLVAALGAKAVVVGPDFRFGKGRAGDAALLERLGKEHGFEVRRVAPVSIGDERASSTAIRGHLKEGDVARATRLLGRVHDVSGTVVKGDQRGRTIGFPTANLDCDAVTLPADGVYAVVARVLGGPERIIGGVANLGVRPTFEAGRSVEAHLFDFDEDLYGSRLRIGFVARLRGEQKFDDFAALVAQVQRDAAEAREIIASADRSAQGWL